jgi:hypothetical protein
MPRRAKRSRRIPLTITSMVLAAGASRAWGQSIYLAQNTQEELSMPRLRYISMDAEYEDVSYTPKTGGGATDTKDLYLSPAIGIGWDYYLYHPDLFTFSLLAEPGYTWQQFIYAGGSSQQNEFVVNGNFKGTLLQAKPYATTITYSRGHDETQYNFYDSVTQDSDNFGVDTGYRQGPVPVTVTYQHSDLQDSGLTLNTTSVQDSFNLHANNTRQNGNVTDLSYQFCQYDSTSTYSMQSFSQSTTTHYLTLTDQENFGKNSLNSSLVFSDQAFDGVASDSLNLSLDLEHQHTPNLRSFYDYTFQYYTTDGFDSIDQTARMGLQHQLYESLISSIDVHGGLADSSSLGASLDQQTAGTAAQLSYNKQLSSWGHLNISDSAGYDMTDQQSSGSALPINNEPHTVPPTGLFFLSQPLDLSLQSITYFNGVTTIVLVPGVAPAGDYSVIKSSDPWQIQVYSTGPGHVNLATSPTVQVNYTVQPTPSGSYSTLNNQFQVRLDFWNNHAGVYARYNYVDNYADSPAFILDNINEFQAGADFFWKGFRCDANYTDHQSTFYSYRSESLSEGYSFRASAHSSAGIDLRQQWSAYEGTATNSSPNLTYYSFTGHYDWQPLTGLTWHNEAGYEQQRGAGEDQNLIVARSYLTWFIGKLDFRLGYEYQNQEYPAETDSRNYVFLRMRRNF